MASLGNKLRPIRPTSLLPYSLSALSHCSNYCGNKKTYTVVASTTVVLLMEGKKSLETKEEVKREEKDSRRA